MNGSLYKTIIYKLLLMNNVKLLNHNMQIEWFIIRKTIILQIIVNEQCKIAE